MHEIFSTFKSFINVYKMHISISDVTEFYLLEKQEYAFFKFANSKCSLVNGQ